MRDEQKDGKKQKVVFAVDVVSELPYYNYREVSINLMILNHRRDEH